MVSPQWRAGGVTRATLLTRSTQGAAAGLGLSQSFVGFVILPIIGSSSARRRATLTLTLTLTLTPALTLTLTLTLTPAPPRWARCCARPRASW